MKYVNETAMTNLIESAWNNMDENYDENNIEIIYM